jgi:hypothetical protein
VQWCFALVRFESTSRMLGYVILISLKGFLTMPALMYQVNPRMLLAL